MCTGGVELKLWDQLPSSMVKKRARSVRCKVRDFAITLPARKVSGAFEKRAPVAAETRNSRYMCCKEKNGLMLCSFGKKRRPFIHLTVLLPFSLQTGNRWCLRHSKTCPSLHPAGCKWHREQRRWRRPTGRRRFWWRWRHQHYWKYVTVLVHNIITTCLWKVQCQRLIVLFGREAYARTDPANRILPFPRERCFSVGEWTKFGIFIISLKQ